MMKKKITGMLAAILALETLLTPIGGGMTMSVYAAEENISTYDDEEMDEAWPKEIEDAKAAIESALEAFEVSNYTTEGEMMNMAKAALKGSQVIVQRVEVNIYYPATTTAEGILYAYFSLSYNGKPYSCETSKAIPMVNAQDVANIDKDHAAVKAEIDKVTATNKTTTEELLNIARAAVKNGTTVVWGPDLKMTKADFEQDGFIRGTLFLTLNKERRTIFVNKKIPMFVRKIPTNKISVCKEEWEILRIVNVERAKEGATPVLMTSGLQEAGNIREKELSQKYSHIRPNGKSCFTAISKKFQSGRMGENIALQQGYRTDNMPFPQIFMNGWMNSPGHRRNILDKKFGYIGVGFYETDSDTRSRKWAVQIFTSGLSIKSWTTSSGKTNFEDEVAMMKEYLICTDSNGVKSYMPLDTAYMTKTKIGYTMKLYWGSTVTLSIGKENAGKELDKPVVKKPSFSKKPKAAKKGFTVYWKKVKDVSGYEISYSTSSKFTKKTTKSKVVKKASSTKLTVNKLKAKKKYYVRIRAYKTVKGVKYYSEWSAKQSVVTKK